MVHDKQRILVVEDQQEVQSIISVKLERAGFEVFHSYNGAEALRFLDTETVDLVVLDLMLPLVSGKEVLLSIRHHARTKDIPVLVLTAKTLESDVVETMALGADDYMKKPFDPAELIVHIRRLIELKHA
ncbi:MAG TPA: response regulator [Bacteroidota bacterium]|nr:response regulator [Bacteroidota bacterium]